MSSLADRLRGIVAAVPSTGHRRAADAASAADGDGESTTRAASRDAVADLLGGSWVESGGQSVLVVDRLYRPGHRHGRLALLDHVLPEDDRWCDVFLQRAPDGIACGTQPSDVGRRTLFIDLETTGLAGGAGTYAFLVGLGWFEGCSFRVRQLFMSSASVERAMLSLLEGLAASTCLIVSFNGKSFDLPLIETRYLFHRQQTPFALLPHLDMLHPARRLWRGQADEDGARGGCRLSTLEQSVCGHMREDDVPGAEAPARYFHFVRTGDARPLAGVFEHNRLDILSLAFLTARAAQLAGEGPPRLTTAREAVGLGQLYERAGDIARARHCFARASAMDGAPSLPGDDEARAEGLHGYAVLCRRERRYADAAGAWRRLLELRSCPPALARDASEALAVHHEHRQRDLRAAQAFALRSASLQRTAARRQALQHRLSRLDSKIAAQPLSLF